MSGRRELCESAKRGHLCIDDLCHTGGETLCGFCQYDYDDVNDPDTDDCMDCGVCDSCIERTRSHFEEMEAES
jgi:hypothetical protein